MPTFIDIFGKKCRECRKSLLSVFRPFSGLLCSLVWSSWISLPVWLSSASWLPSAQSMSASSSTSREITRRSKFSISWSAKQDETQYLTRFFCSLINEDFLWRIIWDSFYQLRKLRREAKSFQRSFLLCCAVNLQREEP